MFMDGMCRCALVAGSRRAGEGGRERERSASDDSCDCRLCYVLSIAGGLEKTKKQK